MNADTTSTGSQPLLYRLTLIAALASGACLALPGPVHAQVLSSGKMLPLVL